MTPKVSKGHLEGQLNQNLTINCRSDCTEVGQKLYINCLFKYVKIQSVVSCVEFPDLTPQFSKGHLGCIIYPIKPNFDNRF